MKQGRESPEASVKSEYVVHVDLILLSLLVLGWSLLLCLNYEANSCVLLCCSFCLLSFHSDRLCVCVLYHPVTEDVLYCHVCCRRKLWYFWVADYITPSVHKFLQYFDTVGWVFWPVKTVSRITYTVLAGT